jgi:hypothetical protein
VGANSGAASAPIKPPSPLVSTSTFDATRAGMNIWMLSMATLVRSESAEAMSTARCMPKRAMNARASRNPSGT